MLSSAVSLFAQEAPTIEEVKQQLDLDSLIMTETFYYLTVVIMWLIHVGFMAYEAGVARRKNVMSTAMKNILTIAVVTPTLLLLRLVHLRLLRGGLAEERPRQPRRGSRLLRADRAVELRDGPEHGEQLTGHLSLVFFLAFLLFSWTTASIMSGCAHRARAALRLPHPRGGRSARGYGSWTPPGAGAAAAGSPRGSASTMRSPRSSCTASPVRSRLGVLLNLGPRIGKYDVMGRARAFRPHNTHMTLMGLMLIFTGFYGFYAACLFIQSTAFPGWLNIYLSPTTLGAIAMVITFGFAGGFTGGWFASKGDPFWTLSGGLAGVISVSAGADVYHPSLAYLLSVDRRHARRLGRRLHREEAARRRCRRSGRRPRLLRLLRRVPRRHLLPAATRPASTTSRVVVRRPADGRAGVPAARVPARGTSAAGSSRS